MARLEILKLLIIHFVIPNYLFLEEMAKIVDKKNKQNIIVPNFGLSKLEVTPTDLLRA